MAGTTKSKAAEMLRSHDRYVRLIIVVAAIAAVVAAGTALALRRRGLAKVHEITVLDCQYTGNGAHTHNADCFDAAGNLICPLPERELHTHDDSCYTETTTLICDQEEGEEHTHTDDCYEVTRELTCGQEEVTEEHVHGPACFTTIVVSDDDEAEVVVTESPSLEQTFSQDLYRMDGSGNEYVFLSASVDAPAGTLPTGASLRVNEVSGNAADQVEAVIARDLGAGTVVKRMDLAELALTDADGNEVAPSGTVEVKLSSALVRESDELVLVQLPDEARGITEASIMDNVSLVNWNETDLSVGNEDTLMFWTNEQLSSYAIVEVDTTAAPDTTAQSDDPATTQPSDPSSLIEITLGEQTAQSTQSTQETAIAMPEQSFEGTADNVHVVVKAPQGALPAGTTMQVKTVDVQEATDTVTSAMPGIFDDVAAVDITFLDASGNEVQPLIPIKVVMTNTTATTQGQPVVLHVDEDGEASVVAQSAVTTASDEVVFDTNDF